MNVKLIRYTPDALDLLLDTKATRLRGKTAAEMTEAEKYEHFQYMLDTIKSPFDFVDYVFDITDVSKNFTHQLVRTRTGAYNQEAARAVNMAGAHIIEPEFNDENLDSIFAAAIQIADTAYQELIANGAARQDARAVLPSNMATNIKAKFNLRTMSDLSKIRLCSRAQGEYQQVFRLMREEVIKVHPWAEPLLQVHCVAMGTCAFPNFGKVSCTFYQPWMDLSEKREELRKIFWMTEMQTSNPIAENGMALDTISGGKLNA